MKIFNKSILLIVLFSIFINNIPLVSAQNDNFEEYDVPLFAYQNITLPKYTNSGENIVWLSDKPEYLTSDGIVRRPSRWGKSEIVTLTATTESGAREYKVLIPPIAPYGKIVLNDEFDTISNIDTSALGNGTVSNVIEDEKSILIFENTSSAQSRIGVNLEEGIGNSEEPIVEVNVRFLSPTSGGLFMYSSENYIVGRSAPHSSGSFVVAQYAAGTQKNIGNTGIWLDNNYTFFFDYADLSKSTVSLNVNGNSMFSTVPTYRQNDNSIGSNIKRFVWDANSTGGPHKLDYLRIVARPDKSAQELVEQAKANLNIDNADNVTKNLNLPKSQNYAHIIWVSSDETIVSNDGKVNLPKEGEPSKHVTLTAIILCDDKVETKNFDLTLNPYIDTSLEDDISLVEIPEAIQDDIVLPAFPNGTVAQIISHTPDLISDDGKVNIPQDKSRIAKFSIRYTNKDREIIKDYQTIVVKDVPLLKRDGFYRDFNNIKTLDDAGVYVNAGGERFGETQTLHDDILNDTVMSFKCTSTEGAYSPEFRFEQVNGRVMLEFDARIMCTSANFAYIYGDGIVSSMTVSNGKVDMRIRTGSTQSSVNLINSIDFNKWYNFKIEIDCRPVQENTGTAITNVWVDNVPVAVNLSTRGDSTYINRILVSPSNINGELRFDNLKIYPNYEEEIKKAKESFELDSISAIMSNYDFPTRTSNGMYVEFVSTQPEFITDEGRVTRPSKYAEDVVVKVYAVIYKNNYYALKLFNMTIKRSFTDEESVQSDMSAISLGNLSDVRSDLRLPTLGENGSTISWTTSEPSIISEKGVVNRPTYIKNRFVEVVLTAEVRKGNVVKTKSFIAKVIKNNFAYQKYVQSSSYDPINNYYKAVDEDYTTYWSPTTSGKQYLCIDLEQIIPVTKVVLFPKGNVGNINLQYSTDGVIYKNLPSLTTNDNQLNCDFDTINIRYIKAQFENMYIDSGIYEIEVYNHIADEYRVSKDISNLVLKNHGTSGIVLPTKGEMGSKYVWDLSPVTVIGEQEDAIIIASPSKSTKLKVEVEYGEVSKIHYINIGPKQSPSGGGSAPTTTGKSGSSGMINVGTQAIPQVLPSTQVFDDIETVAWAYEAIVELAKLGIINGKDETRFVPLDKITRAEFTKLICIAFKIEKGSDSFSFTDVNEDAWFDTYVNIASSAGIVIGDGNYFYPDRHISRQEMAVMLYRIFNYKKVNLKYGNYEFKDNDSIERYAFEAVEKMAVNNIMIGSGGYFNPKEEASRAEAAKVIYEAFRLCNQ